MAKSAAVGAALVALSAPREAKAYYALGLGLLLGTTLGGALTTTGGVVLTVMLVDDQKERPEESTETRALLEAALVASHNDLGMHVDLLLTSPVAFGQLDRAITVGHGPGLSALERATGVEASVLRDAWNAVSDAPVTDAASARTRVLAFLHRIAPSLRAPTSAAASMAWGMAQECGGSSGSTATIDQVSAWLGVPAPIVMEAAHSALVNSGLSEAADPRGLIHADPEIFLGAFAAHIDQVAAVSVRHRVQAVLRSAVAGG